MPTETTRDAPAPRLAAPPLIDAWLEGDVADLRLVQASRRAAVYRARVEGCEAFVKVYADDRFYGMRERCREPRVIREARALDWLAEELGNPIAVVGVGVRARGWSVRSLIVTSAFEGETLRDIEAPDEALVERLGAFIRGLHDAGMAARSLFGKNLMYNARRGQLALIDVPRARIGREVSRRERLRDLATLRRDTGRWLHGPRWEALVARALPADGRSLTATLEELEALRRRLDHRTPLTQAKRRIGIRFRRSLIGRALGLS